MKELFSGEGRRRLDALARQRMLCAFDFDGTLAPIVSRPEDARLPAEMRQSLLALSDHAPVALITGRSVADLRGRLGFEPDFIVGNHGMEGIPGREAQAAAHRALCEGWRRQLAGALEQETYDPGIQLEDKAYSLSVHYRLASDPERSADALRELFSHLAPQPRLVAGKYVFNLVPEDGMDKGGALERLMALCGARSAIYVGDDVTDEDVFRLRRDDLLSVRIERSARSAAAFYLPHPDDMLPLLRDLVVRLRAAGATNWVRDPAAHRA